MCRVVIDTNILLDNPEVLEQYDDIIIPLQVLEELDKLKRNKELGINARTAIRALKNNVDKIKITGFENDVLDTNDNKIIQIAAQGTNRKLLTNDITMQIKAKFFGVELEFLENDEYLGYKKDDEYLGYKEVSFDYLDIAGFYQNPTDNRGCLENQYLIIKSEATGEIIDKQKFTKNGFKPVKAMTIHSKVEGKIKPRNLQQELYIDLLKDKDTTIKVCQGDYGTGKDYLALAVFLEKIESGEFDKIVWVRNNIRAEDTEELGILPGGINEKLAPYSDIISDFVGGSIGFEMLLKQGKVELVHPGVLRGRSFKNSIIYCTEAQNLTVKLTKLILSRVGEDSLIFFNGDVKQTDSQKFRENNGLKNLVQKLKGKPKFGYVYLDKCERSETANYARLL